MFFIHTTDFGLQDQDHDHMYTLSHPIEMGRGGKGDIYGCQGYGGRAAWGSCVIRVVRPSDPRQFQCEK